MHFDNFRFSSVERVEKRIYQLQKGGCIMDNNEERINEEVYPPGVLQLWLENTSAAIFYDRLKSMVMGQDEELKKAAILIYGFLIAMANNRFEKKFHFMIEGSSGCGKSTFAYALQELLPCPVIVADASSITPAGYKGADIADIISIPAVEEFWGCCVLVFDEIDKLMQPTHPSADVNFHLETLHTLLKLMDGGVITGREGNRIYCSKILVIGMGAFTPLRQPKKENGLRRIGFLSDAPQPIQTSAEENITKEQMADFCGSEQFLGRFLSILHFKKLGKDMLLRIAWQTESEIREIYGCGFSLTRERRLEIVDQAMETDFGARGIKAAVWEEFLSSEEEWVIHDEQAFPEVGIDTFLKEYYQATQSA